MSDQGKIEKIHKLDTKHKTASIIKLMEGKHSDAEVTCAALEALGDIADEDSLNEIHIIWNMKILRSVPRHVVLLRN